MIRTLTFGPDDAFKFALFVNLFIGGGNLIHFNPQSGPTSRTRDDRAKEAKVVKAWKAISVVTNEETGERKLRDEGGVIELDQKQHELVLKYLTAAPGSTADADRIDELIDWVSAAEKSEPKATA